VARWPCRACLRLLQSIFRELNRGRLHLALGVGAVLSKRLIVGDDLTPAVAAIAYVVNRARRQAHGVSDLGALVADFGERLGFCCLWYGGAFSSRGMFGVSFSGCGKPFCFCGVSK
jgi:hypothetical protein